MNAITPEQEVIRAAQKYVLEIKRFRETRRHGWIDDRDGEGRWISTRVNAAEEMLIYALCRYEGLGGSGHGRLISSDSARAAQP
jgi:hypothetical protein